MNGDNSEIDWADRLGRAKLDLGTIWETEHSLMPAPVGDSVEDRIIDSVFFLPNRNNEPEAFMLLRIRNIQDLSKEQIVDLIHRKAHMFKTKLWELITAYYKNHNDSFAGFKCSEVEEEVKREIENILSDDQLSCAVYVQSLHEAGVSTFSALADSLAESVIQSLDSANKEAALAEGKRVCKAGTLSWLNLNASEEKILIAYIQMAMGKLIGEDI